MNIVFIVITLLVGVIAGYAIAFLQQQRRYRALEIELATLKTKAEAISTARAELEKTFKVVASDALRNNNQSFLELATQNLGKFQSEARGELDKRQQAFSELIKPIGETLKKTEAQIQEIEKERKQSFGSITSHLQLMAESQQQLQAETRNLVSALRRPEVRGRWGEMMLKRVVELAGMTERCDFIMQAQTDDEESRMRPDMVVHLAENRTLIVDAKTPLDSYLSAIEASDPSVRDNHLQQHSRKVRNRIKELAAKHYWDQFKASPDFVIMFIPGDQYLIAALEKDPELQEQAMRQKILITTPTSLMGLLKIVAYGWRQVALAENAELIRKLATDLHGRLATFTTHLANIGSSLDKAIGNYNNAIGSFERNVLPGARKFNELGVQSGKDIPVLDTIEITPRLPQIKGDSE